MSDPSEIVDSSMLGGLQPIRLPRARAERAERAWWEAGRLCALRSLLQPDDVLFDIGAEQGDMTALYAMWGAQVVAVEPNPKCWPAIRLCVEANGVELVAGFEGFCGSSGESTDQDTWSWPDSAFGEYDPATGFLTLEESPEIPTITADALAVLTATPAILTIDVEGAEGEVLRGASSLMAEDRPYVFLSLHDADSLAVYGDSEASIRQLVAEHDYEWVPISADPHESHVLLCPSERFWGW